MADLIETVAFAAYLTSEIEYRQSDFVTMNFVRAIKGRPIRGYAHMPSSFGSGTWMLHQDNADQALLWWAEKASAYVRRSGLVDPVLVPIPSSQSVEGTAIETRVARVAAMTAARCGTAATVWDGLRWDQPMVPTSHGGPRDPGILYSHLTIVEAIEEGRPHVLIDDVFTSGGHLRAAAALIELSGTEVESAICGAETVHEYVDAPLAIRLGGLPRFVPG